jgi:Glycosyl transferase family 11
MIRVVLLGRTGNILFQYALGRVLSRRHGVPLVLDASWYNAQGWREVRRFLQLPIGARVTRPCSIISRGLRNLTGRHWWELFGKRMDRESGENQSFDPAFLALPEDCTLFGYFQTHLYFDEIADELRADLTHWFHAAVSLDSITASRLSEASSVALHVRRGDYLIHDGLQVCGEEYYSRAIAHMRELVPGARFHVFSDDPVWCREVFVGDDFEVMESARAEENPLHDLLLMSQASHHIIANSSYSWWAAWLGKKTGQNVIMPDRWYRGASSPVAPIHEKNPGGWISVSSMASTAEG